MEGTDSRQWEDLLPDALRLIFKDLSFRENFTVIPAVCKSWGGAVMDPSCWQEIDIKDWSYLNVNDQGKVDQMLQVLITRSSGSPKKLCVSSLQLETSFYFIAEHAHSLQTLRLPRSEMSDSLMEKIAGKFSTLTYLDLSYCNKIGAVALDAIGKNCKSLGRLNYNMVRSEMDKFSQNNEAHAIATTMPKLKHLEIAYNLVDTKDVLEIITNCPELEFLELRGCVNVELDEKLLKEKFPKLLVLGPRVLDDNERTSWEFGPDILWAAYESSDGDDDYDDDYDEWANYGSPPSP